MSELTSAQACSTLLPPITCTGDLGMAHVAVACQPGFPQIIITSFLSPDPQLAAQPADCAVPWDKSQAIESSLTSKRPPRLADNTKASPRMPTYLSPDYDPKRQRCSQVPSSMMPCTHGCPVIRLWTSDRETAAPRMEEERILQKMGAE